MQFDPSESSPVDRPGEAAAAGGCWAELDSAPGKVPEGVGVEAAGEGADAGASCCERLESAVPPDMGPRR